MTRIGADVGKWAAEGLKEGIKKAQLESYAKQPDTRYNVPKEKPKASEEQIDKVIEETEIYREAKEHILKAQRSQVAYGIDKYPEPLNADTWSTIETIDHAIDESVDKLHYLVMLRIKLKRIAEEIELIDKHGHSNILRGVDMFTTEEAKVSEGHLERLRRMMLGDKKTYFTKDVKVEADSKNE